MASAYLHQSTMMDEALVELGHECEVLASTLDASDGEVDELASIDLGEMRATLVTPQGEVLYDSLISTGHLVGHETRPEIALALEQGAGSSIRSSDTLGNVSIYQARRLKSGNVIRVSSDRAGILRILASDLRLFVGVLAVLVILSYVTSRALAARLVKPILNISVKRLPTIAPYEELQPLTDRLAEQQMELVAQMDELRSADAMRREFTANVTHELKTPIATIMGASELLRDGFVLDEDVPDFAARINDEAQRLSALVNDILTLSRLDESERQRTQNAFGSAETVDLLATLNDVASRMTDRADRFEVNLTVEGTSVRIEGYPRMLDEMVANLCSNAIRYNHPGGAVHMWSGVRAGVPTIEVSDTGIGIPQEAQAKVFERFFRVETSRSRASGGTGLGLAIVKHVATLHGAEVSLRSELGEGTVVTVSFLSSAS